ncbi:MAG: Mrp/NBP35 family ATP-binding protein [Proteobacteria bacterium]|nr:Mrp/NBP35 family ATP-binding protein [Pseudomonadota bacterium]
MIHDSIEKAKGDKKSCGTSHGQDTQQRLVQESLAKIKHKILVMSGKGGVGKSSIAANISVLLAQKGYQVGLMDVDVHGPSIAQIMGLKGLLDITQDKRLIPISFMENLKVVSMQSLMQEKNQAVIWRGPVKAGLIHQFIGNVKWGNLDFLVIDSPPGTGDEPLTVVQAIKDARAIIVTTPQEVALADVRKSINFCKTVHIDPLGLVENMGPFTCPGCHTKISLFKSGGGIRTAEEMDIPFLGTLPFEPHVVEACDDGKPIAGETEKSEFTKALDQIVDNIIKVI